MNAGAQVPATPLLDNKGKVTVAPSQMESGKVKLGVTGLVMATVWFIRTGQPAPILVLVMPPVLGVNV